MTKIFINYNFFYKAVERMFQDQLKELYCVGIQNFDIIQLTDVTADKSKGIYRCTQDLFGQLTYDNKDLKLTFYKDQKEIQPIYTLSEIERMNIKAAIQNYKQ